MTAVTEPQTKVKPTPSESSAVSESELRYIGLITRGIAFVIDLALITLVAFLVAEAARLVGSMLHVSQETRTIFRVIGAVAYVFWGAAYFIAFWSATGQTPGNRMMQCRVVTEAGERVHSRRAALRCLGLVLAALPLFLGYLPIIVNRRRRGFADWLAGTVVIDAPTQSFEQAHMEKRRARSRASPG
jgi:uncharacterized RDD family membrane protein YckC